MKRRGFTLIEVLIAVAILAIGLMAVIHVTGMAVRNSERLQQKMLAHWVAMDVLAGARVGLNLVPSAGGLQSGQQQMLGKTYHWKITTANVANMPILKLQVQVLDKDNKQLLDVLQTYIAKPGTTYV